MGQTTLCVPLEVKPESCSRLSALITEFRLKVESASDAYDLVAVNVPTAHFMSMSVFPHAEYDPIFILEANFDGTPGVFWGQLEATFSGDLRAMLRCCKRPLDEDGDLYDAVTAPDSRAPVAPYLEARTQRPSVFHHGNRGLARDRILADRELFEAVRKELDPAAGPSAYRGIPSEAARRNLREKLAGDFPWLREPRPTRIGLGESLGDYLRLLLFVAAVLLVLTLPGLALAPLLPSPSYFVLVGGIFLATLLLIWQKRRGLPGTEVAGSKLSLPPFKIWLLGLLGIAAYVGLATVLLLPLVVGASRLLDWIDAGEAITFAAAFRPVARAVGLGLLSLLLTAPLLVIWIRYLERRDSSNDAPHVDERILRELVRREDWIAQNHMGSIVLIKPGVLRSIVIHAGHLGLGLLLRVTARSGYLGSMRTVHFAHWAFLNNGSRLLFLSNFDHSWDSYLDDFIEKAAHGLTIAWGSGVGFPPARFLLLDGAAHGRQFKTWALASRAVTRFWYSAYRDLTVDQIERNHRIANGLRPGRLSEKDASAWMRDL